MTTALTRNAQRCQLDAFGPDISGLTPLGEAEFAAMTHEMVADAAPRLFAVVEEYGERDDAAITAWGMAFPDHAEVVSVEGRQRMSLKTPEDTLRMYRFDSHIRARLVWFSPDAATPAEDADEAA